MRLRPRITPLRALVIYLVAGPALAWLAYVVTEAFGLPGWLFPVAVGLIVIGLPIVVTTAVVQARGTAYFADGPGVKDPDPTPIEEERRRRSRLPDDSESWSGVHSLFNWRNAIGGGFLAAALWALLALGWWLLLRQDP